VRGLWQDWTLLSMVLFTLFSFTIILFDENHHPQLTVFIASATLFACLGAWGYFRLGSPILRTLALFGSLALELGSPRSAMQPGITAPIMAFRKALPG